MMEAILELVSDSRIHPYVGKVFEWGQAKAAFEALVKQSVVGKMVVKVGA